MHDYFVRTSWQLAEIWIGPASPIIGGVVMLVLVLAWLWSWLVQHESDLKTRWLTFLQRPRAARFRQRFALQIQFLQDRLSPTGYLGLHLTIGALIIFAAGWCFGGIVEDIFTGDPLTVIDKQAANWFHEHAIPVVTKAAIVTTFLGSPPFLGGASLATALFLTWRRWWHRLLALVLTMGGGSLLIILLKTIFHRQRPIFENPLITVTSYSFPSGHVMGSTLFYLFVAGIISVSIKQWRWRVLTFLTAFTFVLLVGLTRTYLGAHYLSDVMGAMAAGVAWLVFSVTAVESLRRYRNESRTSQ